MSTPRKTQSILYFNMSSIHCGSSIVKILSCMHCISKSSHLWLTITFQYMNRFS